MKKNLRGLKCIFVLPVPMSRIEKELWDQGCFRTTGNSLCARVCHIH